MRLRGLALPRAALALAAVAATAPLAAGPESDGELFERYLALVRRYRDDAPGRAVQRLTTWSAEDVHNVVDKLRKLLERHDPKAPLVAAVAVHTEAGFRLREHGRHEQADLHINLAHGLLTFEPPPPTVNPLPTDAPLGRIWFRTVGYHYTAHAVVDLAEYRLDEGIHLYPRDARLWLARGGVDELIARVGAQREDGRRARGRGRSVYHRARGSAKARYEEAAAAYETALELGPDLIRTRLRLARVSHALGDFEAAGELLQAVADGAPDPPILFLTHLFLGDLFESRGDLKRALAEYRAAVAIHPQSSSGRLALSYAQLRSGERGAAADNVRAALAAEEHEDLWLSYLAGAAELEVSTRELRELATSGGRGGG